MNIDFDVKDITMGVIIIIKGVMNNTLGIIINAFGMMIIEIGVIIISMSVIIITMGVMIISYAQYFFNFNINISFLIFIISSILLACLKNILLYIFYIFLELLAQVFHHLNQIPKFASFNPPGC